MTLIEASLGKTPIDLLITNVRLANVLTGEIYPTDIAIYGGQIVAVEPPGTQPQRQASRVLDGNGQLMVPGLIDSHLHIESSLVTSAPFAEAVLRRGITTVAEDPHEIANATGLPGVKHFLEASRDLPFTILFLASTCVPAAKGLEHCRGELGPEEIRKMLGWEGVIGLAEVMDAQAVVDEDPRMSAILQAGRDAGGVIEGHNPMLTGRELQAYITAGVNSDHTLASPSRYIEKLRLGVTVQLQERYMSREVIEAIKALPQPLPSLCLVTDDVAPDYLESYGHLDHVLKQAIELGLPPMQALQAATINPARRLRLFDRAPLYLEVEPTWSWLIRCRPLTYPQPSAVEKSWWKTGKLYGEFRPTSRNSTRYATHWICRRCRWKIFVSISQATGARPKSESSFPTHVAQPPRKAGQWCN